MFIDMENSPSDYLQDMLVSENLSALIYTGPEPEWIVFDTPIMTEIVFDTRIN